jgi:hypothetical protein
MKDELHMKLRRGETRAKWSRLNRVHSLLRRDEQTALQNVVKACEQMRNGFLGFVAHVGKAKGLAPDFAVTGVDDEMVFRPQVAREF